MSSKVIANTPTLNGTKSVSSGLGKLYFKQLTSQLDLQFALTLKLMDKNPLIANFDRAALDKLVESSPEVREQTKNDFTEAVNKAVEEAKRIAQEQRPITVTMDDEPIQFKNTEGKKP
jgi:hypothetical protein